MGKQERERARRYGVRQAMAFCAEMADEPTLAEEVGKYVLPSSQWRKTFRKACRRNEDP